MSQIHVELVTIWHKVYDDAKAHGWGPFPSADAANKAVKAFAEAAAMVPGDEK